MQGNRCENVLWGWLGSEEGAYTLHWQAELPGGLGGLGVGGLGYGGLGVGNLGVGGLGVGGLGGLYRREGRDLLKGADEVSLISSAENLEVELEIYFPNFAAGY